MSVPATPAPGPSDPGLSGERTALAWARMGMTLLGIPSAVMAYAAGRDLLAGFAAGLAAGLGLALLLVSLRRQRASPGMVQLRSLQLASAQVVLTAVSVLSLSVAGALLVLGR